MAHLFEVEFPYLAHHHGMGMKQLDKSRLGSLTEDNYYQKDTLWTADIAPHFSKVRATYCLYTYGA